MWATHNWNSRGNGNVSEQFTWEWKLEWEWSFGSETQWLHCVCQSFDTGTGGMGLAVGLGYYSGWELPGMSRNNREWEWRCELPNERETECEYTNIVFPFISVIPVCIDPFLYPFDPHSYRTSGPSCYSERHTERRARTKTQSATTETGELVQVKLIEFDTITSSRHRQARWRHREISQAHARDCQTAPTRAAPSSPPTHTAR